MNIGKIDECPTMKRVNKNWTIYPEPNEQIRYHMNIGKWLLQTQDVFKHSEMKMGWNKTGWETEINRNLRFTKSYHSYVWRTKSKWNFWSKAHVYNPVLYQQSGQVYGIYPI